MSVFTMLSVLMSEAYSDKIHTCLRLQYHGDKEVKAQTRRKMNVNRDYLPRKVENSGEIVTVMCEDKTKNRGFRALAAHAARHVLISPARYKHSNGAK